LKTADDVAQEKFGLNVEEEKEIGEKVHQLIIRERQVADLPESQQRIERLAKPILETLERPRISYTFTIIDDDSINAFALPGGYIYVHTGLLDFVKTDPELQFVLGHEIGHVDLKHCIRNFTFAVRAAQASGGLAELPVQVVYNQYSLQFSEDSEFEADAYGFVRLVKFGRTRREALRFPSRLIEFHKSEGVATSQEKAKSVPDAMRQGFMNHFRTHPPSEDRLKKLEAIKIPGTDQ